VEIFQATINQCFNTAIENMMGAAVKEQVLQLLERNHIARSEIAARFDDVVVVLIDAFGNNSRLLIYRTVVELYEEYSLRPTFGFNDSLREQMIVLKNRVIADILKPRHSPRIDDSIYLTRPKQDVY
jgi:hypothetical protein